MGDVNPRDVTPISASVSREELRRLHLEMISGVMAGRGVEHVAELAARRLRAPVAIVGPDLGSALAGAEKPDLHLATLERYVSDRVALRRFVVPPCVAGEAPIGAGDELVGVVMCLAADDLASAEIADCLHAAAVAALTEFAICQTRNEVERTVRSSLLEDLLSGAPVKASDVLRRAQRIQTDLTHGAIAVCAQLETTRPRQTMATTLDEHPGALGELIGARLYILLPAESPDPGREFFDSARRVGTRLEAYGQVGVSSWHRDPALLSQALQEAELVLEVLQQSGGPPPDQVDNSTYRLLFRVLSSHPDEVTRFYQETVAALVTYDDQYSTDLLGTLEAYLGQDCNMNATAAAIYAHRHTIAYRLDRIRELTKLDPTRSEDRERLGLGLKAYRIIQPRLPR